MNVIHEVCCGLDVHKKTVVACLIRTDASGAPGEPTKEIRTFSTMTADLNRLASWLAREGCRHVAMESTGVYWRPVFNILEPHVTEILLLNAQHIKNVPGRKTDVKDAEWIADLLRHGLVRGSFIPPAQIRELRMLTRYRTTLVRQTADECNRLQKLLEMANIKLASVASDILGKSGLAMLEALAQGCDDPDTLAELAKGRLRAKKPQLKQALDGHFNEPQRFLLGVHLGQIAHYETLVAEVSAKIEELILPFQELVDRLDEIPGINQRTAQILVAECGVDMSRFATSGHLASWAGMCPGNRESGGKRLSGKTRKGNPWLRSALVEAGWAAGKTKGTYFQAQYGNIVRRRGQRRGCIAVGHSILVVVHRLMSTGERYRELGSEFLNKRSKEAMTTSLVGKLKSLGYEVALGPIPAA
jgi:transposase